MEAGFATGARGARRGGQALLLLLLAWAPGAPMLMAREATAELTAPRIIAVGDVHGAEKTLSALLRHVGILDRQGNWSGGSSVFVQLGDFLDRGADDQGVLELLRRLQAQAPRHGGEVIVLLGNHEVMNLVGDLRYVSRQSYAHFVTEKSEKQREQAYKSLQKYLKRRARRLGREAPELTDEHRRRWMLEHPPGYLEHREAFSSTGEYGKWLRLLPTAVKLEGIVFVHGGIHPGHAHLGLETLNERIRTELRAFDRSRSALIEAGLILPFFELPEILGVVQEELSALETTEKEEESRRSPSQDGLRRQTLRAHLERLANRRQWLSFSADGPLWYRGYAKWTPEEAALHLGPLLEALGAERIAVAHTPQHTGVIQAMFDSQLFLIDTGLLGAPFFPGGAPAALEVRGNRISAVYLDRRDVLLD